MIDKLLIGVLPKMVILFHTSLLFENVCGKGKLLFLSNYYGPDICMYVWMLQLLLLLGWGMHHSMLQNVNKAVGQRSQKPTTAVASQSIYPVPSLSASPVSRALPWSARVHVHPCSVGILCSCQSDCLPHLAVDWLGWVWVGRWVTVVLPWSCWIFHRLFRTKFLLPLAFIVGWCVFILRVFDVYVAMECHWWRGQG